MFQIINWICLICISFLVFDIMIYFCKDILKIYKDTEMVRGKKTCNTRLINNIYEVEHKIAK
ncbi:MAG: hypothetical protein RRZ84_09535 [Romboutsia sp.]